MNTHTLSKFYQEHRYKYMVDGNPGALERIVGDLNTIICTFRRNVINNIDLVANLSASLNQKGLKPQYEHTR